MNNLLILFFIPFVCFVQYTKYYFLDSNLKRINVENTKKLTKDERKKIHHYEEFYFNKDGFLIGYKIFYAEGKYPSFPNGDFTLYEPRHYSFTTFKNGEKWIPSCLNA